MVSRPFPGSSKNPLRKPNQPNHLLIAPSLLRHQSCRMTVVLPIAHPPKGDDDGKSESVPTSVWKQTRKVSQKSTIIDGHHRRNQGNEKDAKDWFIVDQNQSSSSLMVLDFSSSWSLHQQVVCYWWLGSDSNPPVFCTPSNGDLRVALPPSIMSPQWVPKKRERASNVSPVIIHSGADNDGLVWTVSEDFNDH